MNFVHTSVLKAEVLDMLRPETADALLIDGTLGEGGHSEAFLDTFEDLSLIGLDADSEILKVAAQRLARFGERADLRNVWFNQFYHNYPKDLRRPDLVLFDLGISVYHYEKGGRGFTFQKDEPLDMRLDGDLEISAADIVNTYPEAELADILYQFGEERYSRRIARRIVALRREAKIASTKQLADIIWEAVPRDYRYGRIHPGTRSFQALRIAVNGEMVRLESVLRDALAVLKPGGKMGVISFHSLEDRQVKRFFADKYRDCVCPPELPRCECGGGQRVVELLTRKPIRPGREEVEVNSPSRSARFRVIRKLRDEE